jgi:hypothetical protein
MMKLRSTKLLKISANYICSQLTYICNKSVLKGIFPERLKNSTINPLYKKGDKTDPSNYRPISWLSSGHAVVQWLRHCATNRKVYSIFQ